MLPRNAAEQVAAYFADSYRSLGAIPSQQTLVLERFFDESGGMQLVLHAPFGSRINKAWSLALRKRFCRQFNFELQAAATEDGLLLSLGLGVVDVKIQDVESAGFVADRIRRALEVVPPEKLAVGKVYGRGPAGRRLPARRRRAGSAARLLGALQRVLPGDSPAGA